MRSTVKPAVVFGVLAALALILLSLTSCGPCESGTCGGAPVDCPDGYSLQGGACVPPTQCPAGQVLVDAACRPPAKCEVGYVLSADGQSCVQACDLGQVEATDGCLCDPATQREVGGLCCILPAQRVVRCENHCACTRVDSCTGACEACSQYCYLVGGVCQ